MATISGIIMTRNEGHLLHEALSQMSEFCEEIIVIDVECTDNSREICSQFKNVSVYGRKMGMNEADREFAFSKMNCDWGFFLDPDERMDPQLRASMKALAKDAEKRGVVVLSLPRRFKLPNGKFLRCIYPDYQTRFFKKGCLSFRVEPHGRPIITGGKHDYVSGKGDIIHMEKLPFYRDNKKFRRWVYQLEVPARMMDKCYFTDNLIRAVYVPPAIFLYHFVWRKGFLDGFDGFLYALFWARYRFSSDLELAKIRFRKAIRTVFKSQSVED
jgi:glycosyltransferase involved in cell wall biosynthesis